MPTTHLDSIETGYMDRPTYKAKEAQMPDYEITVTTTQRITVRATSESEAKATALNRAMGYVRPFPGQVLDVGPGRYEVANVEPMLDS
jgi:hypothetical protein